MAAILEYGGHFEFFGSILIYSRNPILMYPILMMKNLHHLLQCNN